MTETPQVPEPLFLAIDFAGDPFFVFPADNDAVVVKTPEDAVLLSREAIVELIITLQNYTEGPEASLHTLVVDEEGWLLSHSAACTRSGVTSCPYSTASEEIRYGQFQPGKYRAGLDDHGHLTATPL